jgi:dihydrolipoamide dehydrogenase
MNNFDYDVVVIGGGPGGYNCAIRAAQLGFKTACVEKGNFGGTCLNVGCIPSKALLESSGKYSLLQKGWLEDFGLSLDANAVKFDLAKVMESKNKIVSTLVGGIGMLLTANGVTSVKGFAEFIDKNRIKVKDENGEKVISAEYFIIATGSSVAQLGNTEFDEKVVISSDSGINLQEVPKNLVIIGAGVIGLELGSVWSRFGAKVTVLEYLDVAAPTMDQDVSAELLKLLKKQGIEFRLGVSVTKIENKGDKAIIYFADKNTKKEETLECDKVMVSIGRKPNTAGLGLEKVGVKTNERGYIINTDLQTNVENIYAIGDVTTGPMLAHKAEEEGSLAVEIIDLIKKAKKEGRTLKSKPQIHHDIIPAVIYTHPEAASIGKTERELKAKGIKYNVGKVAFAANGRAKTMRETDGFVKLICDEQNNKILGAHIVHAYAGSMINELSAYMAYEASPDDIVLTVHTHPDLNEVIRAAALDVLGRPMASMPRKKK